MKNKNNLTEVEYSPFDTPIPGQSLTDEPGNYPWEHAPQFTDCLLYTSPSPRDATLCRMPSYG